MKPDELKQPSGAYSGDICNQTAPQLSLPNIIRSKSRLLRNESHQLELLADELERMHMSAGVSAFLTSLYLRNT